MCRISNAVTLTLAVSVLCHSWVDRLYLLDADGKAIGKPGRIRGFGMIPSNRKAPMLIDVVPRSVTTANLEDTFLIPSNLAGRPYIIPTDLLCRESQRVWNYTMAYPPLNATAEGAIMLQYNENGHITIPANNPPNRQGKSGAGSVYVYGTQAPSAEEKIMDVHKIWTKDAKDRGSLLGLFDFDDGKCYQYSLRSAIEAERATLHLPPSGDEEQGKDLWCSITVHLPQQAQMGVYTLYWVWDWSPTGQDGARQIYTSCMDVLISTSSTNTSE